MHEREHFNLYQLTVMYQNIRTELLKVKMRIHPWKEILKFSFFSRALDKSECLVISRNIFLFLKKTICCDPSSEPSRRDGFNEWSQHMF